MPPPEPSGVDRRPLRVVFCPGGQRNPYLDSLGAAMEPLGWRSSHGPNTTWLLRDQQVRQADVIHLHWPDGYLLARTWLKSVFKSLAFLAQLWCGRLLGKRIVWTCHNLRTHDGRFPGLQAWAARRLLSVCHVALAHSPACVEAVLEQHGQRFRPKMRPVRHANYLEDYPQGIPRADARQKLGVDDEAFVFLFVGAVRGYKGIDVLLEHFAELDLPEARLIIAGRPGGKEIDDQLREKADADPRVTYHNEFVPADEMQVYMASADVVVIPYRSILTSGTLLLAASFGKVAIVPDAPTLLDTVSEQGVIPFDRSTDASLGAALREAVATRDTLTERGAASRQAVREWGWPEMAAATVDAYNANRRSGR